MPVKPEHKVERVPTVGGMDTVLNGGSAAFTDNEWNAIEWTLGEDLHLTAAIACIEGWKPGDHGFAAVANPAAMWIHHLTAAQGQKDIDLGPNAAVDLGGFTLANLYDPAWLAAADPDDPRSEIPVWIEFWKAQGTFPTLTRTKNPGLVERREVDSVSGTVITLKKDLAQEITAQQFILIPEYDEPYGPEDCAHNLGGAGPHDGLGMGGGIFFCGSGGPFRLGSPDRSETTQKIKAGMCVCLRVHGIDSGTGDQRCLSVTFEMRRPEE